VSFSRHKQIYNPMSSMPGRPGSDRPRPHRYDEFPAGYSSARCARALPACASPGGAHREAGRGGSTIEMQRTVPGVLTTCLTQGDNAKTPMSDEDGHAVAQGTGLLISKNGIIVTKNPSLKRAPDIHNQ
jgi:hypothetical protein